MIPPLWRSLRILLGGVLVGAVISAKAQVAETPVLTALSTPPQARGFEDAQWGYDGWIYAAENALCLPDGTVWIPPSSLQVALPLPGGDVIAAGRAFCSLISHGHERRLVSTGYFAYGAVLGDTALVASPQGVWAISHENVVGALPMHGTSLSVYVFRWRDHLYVTSDERGNFVYQNGEFRPVHFPWGDATWFNVKEGRDGFIAVARGRLVCGPSAEKARPVQMSATFVDLLDRQLLDGFALCRGKLLFTTLNGGLYGYRLQDGSLGGELFHLSARDLGGSPYFLNLVAGQLVLGTSTGVFLLADPDNYAETRIPTGGEIYSVSATHAGANIYSSGGTFRLDGTPLPEEHGLLGKVETPAGLVKLHFTSLTLPSGRNVDLGERETALVVAYENGLAVVHGPRFSFISLSGERTEVPLPAANSLAICQGDLVVGTADGAYRFQGRHMQRWLGIGPTYVASDNSRFLAAVDSAGTFFGGTGAVVGRISQGARMISAAVWNGTPVYLLQLNDGRIALGSWIGQSWTPYPFPMPEGPVAAVVDDHRFEIVGADAVVSALDLAPAPAPELRPHLSGGAGPVPWLWSVSSRAQDVSFVLPSPLAPWLAPIYAVSVSGGEWEAAKAGAPFFLPRLPWGRTEISLRADFAGRIDQAEFVINHPAPWWARWPALVADAVLAMAAAWLVVLWRTRHLRRRALLLEGMVSERTAELRKAQAAREEFFSSVSHEIRNPLNGVIGLCDMLNETASSLAGRDRSLVNTMKGCADQLRTILDDVLDFSKIERGQIHIHEEVFELNSAIDGAARGIDPRLERCRLELGEPVWLRGDSGKLRQVVTNLVSNALKYGSPPVARVKLLVSQQVAGMLGVEIVVSNTGPTIPPEDFARMFEGFARGGDVERRNIPGMGLGLAVSRRLMQAMKGSLIGRSHEGLTEFVAEISLPQADPPEEPAPGASEPVEKVARALAIEDEAYNRLILGHLLGQMGYEVDWAVDGASALELAGANAYDLILTDFVLPDTDGATLARKILAMLPDPKPPVVAVTAYSTKEKVAEARAAGITGFVAKPISRRKLEAAILGVGEAERSSRPIDVAAPAGDWDFAPLLRLPDGRQALAEFAEGLAGAWDRVAAEVAALAAGTDSAGAAKAVHAFRGRILTVHAQDLAEQLATLESVLRSGGAGAAERERLAGLIGPMVRRLASAASEQALAPIRSA